MPYHRGGSIRGTLLPPFGPGDSRDLPGARRGADRGFGKHVGARCALTSGRSPHHRREQGRHRGGGRLIAEKGRVLASLASMPMWR